MKKTYEELISFNTYDERLEYLKIEDELFHKKDDIRYFKQIFYKKPKWKHTRQEILVRDNGYDLGIKGINIRSKVIVHHINPITSDDILLDNYVLYDPNNLISVSLNTHNLIHYRKKECLIIERYKDDTIPWR